jgi:hypothetical protein
VPTKLPTSYPTKFPTRLPTNRPTPYPTYAAPTNKPTKAPTSPYDQCPCTIPSYLNKFSLITKEDAQVSAHNIYTGIAIGGTLNVFEPQTSKVVDGKAFMKAISPAQNHGVNFNGGLYIGPTPLTSAGVNFASFEEFAKKAQSSESGNYKVIVFTVGGRYNMRNVRPAEWQDEDNGQTLVVFNTSEDVIFESTPDNRKWGPSVIAPFSKVIIADKNDFNDGYVVAKSFVSSKTSQQLHGDPYDGPVKCNC